MVKSEILDLVLDYLIEDFRYNPDSLVFHTDCSEYSSKAEYIAWQINKVDSAMTNIEPNKSILITFSPNRGSIALFLFNKNFNSIKELEGNKYDSAIEVKKILIRLSAPYKKFKKLKKMIIERDKKRENEAFMKKLNSFFPTILDDEIFGRED
jgi:hypothetical protein